MATSPWWRPMRFSRTEIEWAKTQADLVWKGVELAERVADGLTDLADLKALFASPEYESWDIHSANEPSFAEDYFTGSDAAWIAKACAYRARYLAKYHSPSSYPFFARFRCPSQLDYDREQSAQCHRLRDIFGNPFRPVAVDPTWLTADVVKLAQTIYDRSYDRLPTLADALAKPAVPTATSSPTAEGWGRTCGAAGCWSRYWARADEASTRAPNARRPRSAPRAAGRPAPAGCARGRTRRRAPPGL